MKITSKREVKSLPLTSDAIDTLYPDVDERNLEYKDYLKKLISALGEDYKNLFPVDKGFSCYIEKRAYDAFNAFAKEIYSNTRNEACGVFMGYYFHNPENENQKIILATNFLEAHGPATRVTCEISFDDNIRYSNFADAHKMLPIVWAHSHPGFGTFYSGTDSDTLSRCFRAPHQMGVVVDILQNLAMGFKIYDNKETNESLFLLDGDATIANSKASIECVYETMSLEKKEEVVSDSSIKTASKSLKKNEKSEDPIESEESLSVESSKSFGTLNDSNSEAPFLASAIITPKNANARPNLLHRISTGRYLKGQLPLWIIVSLLGIISIELLIIILRSWK